MKNKPSKYAPLGHNIAVVRFQKSDSERPPHFYLRKQNDLHRTDQTWEVAMKSKRLKFRNDCTYAALVEHIQTETGGTYEVLDIVCLGENLSHLDDPDDSRKLIPNPKFFDAVAYNDRVMANIERLLKSGTPAMSDPQFLRLCLEARLQVPKMKPASAKNILADLREILASGDVVSRLHSFVELLDVQAQHTAMRQKQGGLASAKKRWGYDAPKGDLSD